MFVAGRSHIASKKDGRGLNYLSEHMSEFSCVVYVIFLFAAIDLNSKFYDTLYGGITWTSPVTLIRLPWNILLLTNWLEVLLIHIYKVQYVCYLLYCGSDEPLRAEKIMYREALCVLFTVKVCYIASL